MPPTIPFPSRSNTGLSGSASESSLVSRQATALEVCDLVYGEAELPESDIVDRIYEASAGVSSFSYRCERSHSPHSVGSFHRYLPSHVHLSFSYENPLVTANSREQIVDLYALCRSCSMLDVPRPLAFLSALFGRHPGTSSVLLRGVRAWSEVTEVSESETFG